MTPDQTQLVDRLYRQVGHLPRAETVNFKAGDIVLLINFLRMEERAAAVSQERLRAVLAKAAEEHLDELLLPTDQRFLIGSDQAPLPPRTAEAGPPCQTPARTPDGCGFPNIELPHNGSVC